MSDRAPRQGCYEDRRRLLNKEIVPNKGFFSVDNNEIFEDRRRRKTGNEENLVCTDPIQERGKSHRGGDEIGVRWSSGTGRSQRGSPG